MVNLHIKNGSDGDLMTLDVSYCVYRLTIGVLIGVAGRTSHECFRNTDFTPKDLFAIFQYINIFQNLAIESSPPWFI